MTTLRTFTPMPAIRPAVPTAPVESFIGKAEVGKRLAMKPRTIDAWMNCGLLPFYKMGRAVRFKWSEVEAHLSANCRVCRRNPAK